LFLIRSDKSATKQDTMAIDNMDRPFLIGDKVYLRPLDLNDVNQKYLNWVNDEDVIRNLAITTPSTLEQLESFVKSILNSSNF
jgi:hypothetical protein